MVLTISVLRVISCHGLVQKDCGSSFDPLSCKRCKFVSRVSHPKRFFLSSFSVKMATDTDISAAIVSGIDIPVMLCGGCGVTVSDYEIPPSPLFPDFLGTPVQKKKKKRTPPPPLSPSTTHPPASPLHSSHRSRYSTREPPSQPARPAALPTPVLLVTRDRRQRQRAARHCPHSSPHFCP